MAKINSFVFVLFFALPFTSEAFSIRVVELNGKATLTEGNRIQALKKDDWIEAEDGAKIAVALGSDITVAKPGDFGIKAYASTIFSIVSPKNQKEPWNVKLLQGAALVQVKNPKHLKNHFRLSTRVATMGVRGTTFYVRDVEGKPVFFCPCKGEIQVSENTGNKSLKLFKSKHHDEPTDLSEDAANKVSLSPTQQSPEHSDAEIESLLKLI